MKYLHLTSWTMTILGLLACLAYAALDLDAIWLVGGIFLTWAGVVKIAVVLIWTRIAHLGTDRHTPEKSV